MTERARPAPDLLARLIESVERAKLDRREPTPDESYCDVRRHQGCSGYTEHEADPETCMCECHDGATS